MASNFASSPAVVLKNVRLQWGDLFTPASGEINGQKTTPKYKAIGLFAKDSEAMSVGRKALLDAATALWGANAANVVAQISSNSKALRDGNGKISYDGSV